MHRITSVILFFLSSVAIAMQDEKEQLKITFNQEIAEIQKSIDMASIPIGFEVDKCGEIIQWDPSLQRVFTCFGGIYEFQNNGWEQLRKGEYETLNDFLDDVTPLFYTEPYANMRFHICRNAFINYAYHKGTNTLMYLAHADDCFRRLDAIRYDDTIQPTNKLIFERDGHSYGCYYIQGLKNQDRIFSCASNHNGSYYAVACEHDVDYGDQTTNWDSIKVIKQLPDGSYGDDPYDVLTQGSYSDTKSFDRLGEKTRFYSGVRLFETAVYFKNNHVNFMTLASDGVAKQYIISPFYGLSSYDCVVDCGDGQRVTLGETVRYSCLREKLLQSRPEMHLVKPEKIVQIVKALEAKGLPSELIRSILYTMSYKGGLEDSAQLVYGKSDEVFPEVEKRNFKTLWELKKHIDLVNPNSCTTFYWKDNKKSMVPTFNQMHPYSQEELWNATRYGILWEEEPYSKHQIQQSQLLLKYLFAQLKLPPFQIIKHELLNGEVIINPDGKIRINYINGRDNHCFTYVQPSFVKKYKTLILKDGWGTLEHAQKFVDNNTVQHIDFDKTGSFTVTLSNGDTGLVQKTGTIRDVSWVVSSSLLVGTRFGKADFYYHSPYDGRGIYQIERELRERHEQFLKRNTTG